MLTHPFNESYRTHTNAYNLSSEFDQIPCYYSPDYNPPPRFSILAHPNYYPIYPHGVPTQLNPGDTRHGSGRGE